MFFLSGDKFISRTDGRANISGLGHQRNCFIVADRKKKTGTTKEARFVKVVKTDWIIIFIQAHLYEMLNGSDEFASMTSRIVGRW